MDTKSAAPSATPVAEEPAARWAAFVSQLVDPVDAWRAASADSELLHAWRDKSVLTLGERLRTARGTHARKTVAGWLGVHENTVSKMERGETVPDALQLHQLSVMTGRSVEWLLGIRSAEPSDSATPPPQVEATVVGAQIFIPHFDVRASAGYGAFNDTERVLAMRAFTADYVRHELGIAHCKLAMITVTGSSMEPMIRDGDVVLVDLQDSTVIVEGPHLIRMDGALMVKTLQRRPGGKLRVTSANEAYEPFEVDLARNGEEFEVLGRVRWAGVTFR